jgi:hypothetical protein
MEARRKGFEAAIVIYGTKSEPREAVPPTVQTIPDMIGKSFSNGSVNGFPDVHGLMPTVQQIETPLISEVNRVWLSGTVDPQKLG